MQFPHDIRSHVEVFAMPTVCGNEGEVAIPLEFDSPQPEESQSQNVIPPTPSSSQVKSSQLPITDPASVSSGVQGKPKGHAAKRARHVENVLQTNTAVTYLDLEKESVGSSSGVKPDVPPYLTAPTPTTLMIEELRKHVMISDIEKNRALTCMANKVMVLVPSIHKILKQLDRSAEDNRADHAYQVQED